MIEINLLPGSAKRSTRRGMPRAGGGGGGAFAKLRGLNIDRTVGIVVALWIAAAALVAWMHFSSAARMADLQAQHEAALADSTRFAAVRAQGEELVAQEALIAQKMEVIQQIDAGRYIWAHIFDEVSRALPQYIWLTSMTQAASDTDLPRVRIEGRAGNLYALSRYLEQLETSPFLRGVQFISADRVQVDERLVLSFVLEVGYNEPPPDVIQTVPLFAAEMED